MSSGEGAHVNGETHNSIPNLATALVEQPIELSTSWSLLTTGGFLDVHKKYEAETHYTLGHRTVCTCNSEGKNIPQVQAAMDVTLQRRLRVYKLSAKYTTDPSKENHEDPIFPPEVGLS